MRTTHALRPSNAKAGAFCGMSTPRSRPTMTDHGAPPRIWGPVPHRRTETLTNRLFKASEPPIHQILRLQKAGKSAGNTAPRLSTTQRGTRIDASTAGGLPAPIILYITCSRALLASLLLTALYARA